MTPSQQNIIFFKTLERRLSLADVLSPAVEAEDLITHFGHMNRVDFLTGDKTLGTLAKKKIDQALCTRLKGTPLSHVLKEREFFGLKFFVSPDVLIPRPETEILVEQALKILNAYYKCHPRVSEDRGNTIPAFAGMTQGPKVLDIGTGSGCIAVSLTTERPDCRMTALDVSEKALKVARKNICLHGLQKKIALFKSDLFKRFKGCEKLWDVIVSNPPYVPEGEILGLSLEVRKEPKLALNGGPRGTEVIISILKEAPVYLKKGGWILLEIGAGQSKKLRDAVVMNKFYKNLRFIKDLTGLDRVLVAQKS